MEEAGAGGEGGEAFLEKGEADEVVTGEDEFGAAVIGNADDAATTGERGGDVDIVVGVDGSDSSRQALTWAVNYAGLIGAGVDAVMSWNYPAGYGMGAVATDWNPGEDARDLLAETVASVLGDHIPVPFTQVVREGNAAQVLLDETKDAQMLIVGSRGDGGFAGLLLGSVSAHCAEHAHCPVLVIHGKAQQ